MNLIKQPAEKGYPVVRPLFFHYPEDSTTYELDNEFMLGPNLLIASVLEEGSHMRSLYLPAGCWQDIWNGMEQNLPQGKWIERESPIELIPVYARCNTLNFNT